MNIINLHLAHLSNKKSPSITRENYWRIHTCLNVKYLEIRLKKLRATKLVNADKMNRYRTVKNPGLRTTCIHYAASAYPSPAEILAERNRFSADPPVRRCNILWCEHFGQLWLRERSSPVEYTLMRDFGLIAWKIMRETKWSHFKIAVRTFRSSSTFGLLVTCTFYYMDWKGPNRIVWLLDAASMICLSDGLQLGNVRTKWR